MAEAARTSAVAVRRPIIVPPDRRLPEEAPRNSMPKKRPARARARAADHRVESRPEVSMLRVHHVFVLAVALLAAPLAFAADAAVPPTKEARVDALFAEADRSDTPGCALGIFQDGRIAYSKGYGMANLELG